jgi:hypothetical protein
VISIDDEHMGLKWTNKRGEHVMYDYSLSNYWTSVDAGQVRIMGLNESNDFGWVEHIPVFDEFEIGGYEYVRRDSTYTVPKSLVTVGDRVSATSYNTELGHDTYTFTIEKIRKNSNDEVVGIWGSDIPENNRMSREGTEPNWHYPEYFIKVDSNVNESNDFDWISEVGSTRKQILDDLEARISSLGWDVDLERDYDCSADGFGCFFGRFWCGRGENEQLHELYEYDGKFSITTHSKSMTYSGDMKYFQTDIYNNLTSEELMSKITKIIVKCLDNKN